MTTINFPWQAIGWLAIAVGVVILVGLVFIILFFAVGHDIFLDVFAGPG